MMKTKIMNIELLKIVIMFLITLWFSLIYKCLDVIQYFFCVVSVLVTITLIFLIITLIDKMCLSI